MTAETTAAEGRARVRAALIEQGWEVREARIGRRVELLASRGEVRRRVRVSSKRRGTWQTSLRYAEPDPDPELGRRFWVFVDLSPEGDIFVVPEDWMRADIAHAHRRFLDAHGGVRPRAPKSNHHSVRRERLAQWKERWELLE